MYKIERIALKSLISQLCFLFIIYLRFTITLAKGVFDLQIDKKKKTESLKWIKIVKKTTAYSQNILHVDARCIILKERNTKRFVQNWHSPMSPSTEWSWFFIELVMFSLFAMQLDYCDIQRVFDQK
jgi:hypothetical protein